LTAAAAPYAPETGARRAAPFLSVAQILRGGLFLMLLVSFFVTIEPAPIDLLFVAVFAVFLFSRIRVCLVTVPLILFLMLYNLGGFVSFLEVSSEYKANLFVITSAYMAVMAVMFAVIVAADPEAYFPPIRTGWIIAGTIAGVMGIMGYLNIAGTGATWSLYGRAVGAFKDPNVYSTYLVPPAVFLVNGFMTGKQRWPIVSAAALLIIMAALFLAFSRGAWMNVLLACVMMAMLTYALTESDRLRTRIVVLTVLGTLLMAVMLAVLLSIPQVRELFLDRATLVKDYDTGETGRFGNQLRSIGILLERPLGFGPTYFRRIFGADPHNVYLNAFSSYGWLGGLTYPVLIFSTCVAGWKSVSLRTPYRYAAMSCFCPLFATIVQGFQIDTDHWRHFYILLGLTWGFFGAAVTYRAAQGANRDAEGIG
jgi:hypothetical protein